LSVVAAGFKKTGEAWQAATFTVGREVIMGIWEEVNGLLLKSRSSRSLGSPLIIYVETL
jgi:hypothetical protein